MQHYKLQILICKQSEKLASLVFIAMFRRMQYSTLFLVPLYANSIYKYRSSLSHLNCQASFSLESSTNMAAFRPVVLHWSRVKFNATYVQRWHI